MGIDVEICVNSDTAVSQNVAAAYRGGLLVMVRPRGGGFDYSVAELDLMLGQIDTAIIDLDTVDDVRKKIPISQDRRPEIYKDEG